MPNPMSIKVGDLVCLSKKGERFIYGKTLCSPYYKPILQGNRGLVLGFDSDKKMVKVAWLSRDRETKQVIMKISRKYIKKLNKKRTTNV